MPQYDGLQLLAWRSTARIGRKRKLCRCKRIHGPPCRWTRREAGLQACSAYRREPPPFSVTAATVCRKRRALANASRRRKRQLAENFFFRTHSSWSSSTPRLAYVWPATRRDLRCSVPTSLDNAIKGSSPLQAARVGHCSQVSQRFIVDVLALRDFWKRQWQQQGARAASIPRRAVRARSPRRPRMAAWCEHIKRLWTCTRVVLACISAAAAASMADTTTRASSSHKLLLWLSLQTTRPECGPREGMITFRTGRFWWDREKKSSMELRAMRGLQRKGLNHLSNALGETLGSRSLASVG